MTIFGDFKTGADLEDAVISHLRDWMPTYLAEVERQYQMGQGSLPPIRSASTNNEFSKWPEEQLPALIVISPGSAGADSIKMEGDGTYRVAWVVGLAVIVSAKDKSSTLTLAKRYGAAIAGAILQHPSLSGYAEGVQWEDVRYNDLPEDSERTLASVQMVFRIEVRNVLTAGLGPREPIVDPYQVEDWPTVAEDGVHVAITKES